MSALRKNVASQVLTFDLVNASTGAALTGATVTTKVALDGTQSAGGGTVTELGTGQYKYVPTQAETNGTTAGFSFTATNAVPVNLHCFITAGDPTDAVRQGMTALPNAAAEAAGGLYTRGTGAGQLSQSANGELGVATLTKTLTTYTGNTVQTGDSFARLGAPVGASISADIAGVQADTDNIQTRIPAALDANGFIKADVEDWKGATAPAMTGDAYARLGAPAGASVSADVAAVKADTANIYAAVDSEVAAILAAVDTEVAQIVTLLNSARGEPGQGAPPVNPNAVTKIDYLYKAFRNKVTQTATTMSIFADDATTVDHKSTVSDDGSTFTRGEIATGP